MTGATGTAGVAGAVVLVTGEGGDDDGEFEVMAATLARRARSKGFHVALALVL